MFFLDIIAAQSINLQPKGKGEQKKHTRCCRKLCCTWRLPRIVPPRTFCQRNARNANELLTRSNSLSGWYWAHAMSSTSYFQLQLRINNPNATNQSSNERAAHFCQGKARLHILRLFLFCLVRPWRCGHNKWENQVTSRYSLQIRSRTFRNF